MQYEVKETPPEGLIALVAVVGLKCAFSHPISRSECHGDHKSNTIFPDFFPQLRTSLHWNLSDHSNC